MVPFNLHNKTTRARSKKPSLTVHCVRPSLECDNQYTEQSQYSNASLVGSGCMYKLSHRQSFCPYRRARIGGGLSQPCLSAPGIDRSYRLPEETKRRCLPHARCSHHNSFQSFFRGRGKLKFHNHCRFFPMTCVMHATASEVWIRFFCDKYSRFRTFLVSEGISRMAGFPMLLYFEYLSTSTSYHMRLHICSKGDRRPIPLTRTRTQYYPRLSFGKIFNLTAGVYFQFYYTITLT